LYKVKPSIALIIGEVGAKALVYRGHGGEGEDLHNDDRKK